jgi:hypothetical protein
MSRFIVAAKTSNLVGTISDSFDARYSTADVYLLIFNCRLAVFVMVKRGYPPTFTLKAPQRAVRRAERLGVTTAGFV